MDLSPEWKLLLGCARAKPPTAPSLRRELASSEFDWTFIATQSVTHGVAPLICHNLHKTGLIRWAPPASAQILRSTYYSNAARNALLYNELRRVLKTFRDQRIEVIALKGAALAEYVYSNRALRAMSDVDLLVRKNALDKVEAQLIGMGYTLDENAQPRAYHLQNHYHWVFTKPSAVSIEIHWHIERPNGPFGIDVGGFWDRARPAAVAGVEIQALSPEDLLLHLCQHMHKHAMIGGIRPLCDIAHVTERYNDVMNWTKFTSRSLEWGVAPSAYVALYLAKELLGAEIPASSLNNLEPARFDRLLLSFAKDRILDCRGSSIAANVVYLCSKGRGFRARLTALGNALSPHAVAESYDVPSDSNWRVLPYYALRVKDLLARYGPLLWQAMAGNQKTRNRFEREDAELRLSNWLSSYHRRARDDEQEHDYPAADRGGVTRRERRRRAHLSTPKF
jgi:hypothetical protein